MFDVVGILTVRLLMITLIPFLSELSVSTANAFDPGTSHLNNNGNNEFLNERQLGQKMNDKVLLCTH